MRGADQAEVILKRTRRSFALCIAILGMVCSSVEGEGPSQLMTVKDLIALKQTEADFMLPYGEDSSQFGQLRLPEGTGPFPVAVIIHGGCWQAAYGLHHISPLASAITELGFATWSMEYRRIGNPGGGWPGTFLDVADGVDHLRSLAVEHDLDLDRITLIGHSAGGHLALWAAARNKLREDSPLFRTAPLPIQGVVSLAGVGDLSRLEYQQGCGDAVLKLMGGTQEEVPLRYAHGSPIELLPFGVPQILIQGAKDPIISSQGAQAYQEAAQQKGDTCRLVLLEDAGHFELVIPTSSAWDTIEEVLNTFLR